MDPRFVTKTMHAFLDYPVALSLMLLPFLLQLGGSHPLALWLAVGTGIAAFVLTLLAAAWVLYKRNLRWVNGGRSNELIILV